MKISFKFLPFVLSLFIGGMIFTSCTGPTNTSSGNPKSELEQPSEDKHICNFELVEKREPNCVKEGYERYECECGEMKENFIEPTSDHRFGEWFIIVEPTEYSIGYEVRNCEFCGFEERKEIPALGDNENPSNPDDPSNPDHPDDPIEKEHTDEHPVYYEVLDMEKHMVYCLECEGYSFEEKHDFIENEKTEVCKDCGYSRETGCSHSYIFMYNDSEHYNFCEQCGDIIDRHEHNLYEVSYDDSMYSCGQVFDVEMRCYDCEYVKSQMTVKPHSFEKYGRYDNEYCSKVCIHCGTSDDSTRTLHQFDNVETLLEPTYCVDGIKLSHCSLCDSNIEEIIPWTTHTCTPTVYEIVEPNCMSQGYTVYKCSTVSCSYYYWDNYTPIGDHKYVENVVVKPTCTESGTKIVTCEYNCSINREETIDPLGHNYVDGTCSRCNASEKQEHFEYSYWGSYYTITGIKQSYFDKYCSDGRETVEFSSSYLGLPVKGINLSFGYYDDPTILNNLRKCEIVVPEGVEEFIIHTPDPEVRNNYWNNNKVYLPSTITNISGEMFNERNDKGISSSGYWNIYYGGTITSWLKNVSIERANSLPDITEFYTKEDGMNYSLVENVVVDSSIDYIRTNIFEGFLSLKTLVVPKTVGGIETRFIEGCINLKELTMPYISDHENSTQYSISIICGDYLTGLEKLTVTGGKYLDVRYLPSLKYADFSEVELGQGFEMYLTGCSSLKEIKFPKNIDTITSYAFQDCLSLETIELPSTIMSIAQNAFENCSSLEEIILPEGLVDISSYAFSYCSSLKELNIPESVIYIYQGIVDGCTSLTKCNIPSNIQRLNLTTPIFKDCESMTSFTFNIKAQYYSNLSLRELFGEEGIKRLVNVTLGNDFVPYRFFENCENLEVVNFTTTELTSIGDYAFRNCYKLNNLPELSLSDVLGQSAFENCTSLTSIYLDNDFATTPYTFMGCTSLKEATVNLLARSGMFEECASLEKVTLLTPHTSINSRSFYNCKELATLINESDYELVEEYAFYNCQKLSEFDFSTLTEHIGQFAFYQTGVKEVVLNGSVTIYDGALCGINLDEVRISKDVDLRDDAFNGTIKHLIIDGRNINGGTIPYADKVTISGTSLDFIVATKNATELVLSEGITSICEGALKLLNDVKELTLPESLESLGRLSLPSYLEKITLNSPIKLNIGKFYSSISSVNHIVMNNQNEIIEGQFANLSNLEILESSEDIIRISDIAFDGCASLKDIPSLEKVEYIGNHAFGGCKNITKLVIKTDNFDVGDVDPFAGSGITEIVLNKLPDSFLLSSSSIKNQITKISLLNETSIEDEELREMYALKEVNLNDEITSIGYMAFAYCYSLTDINFPSELVSIGSMAFFDCQNIKNVTFGESFETLGNYAFDGCVSLVEVRNLSSTFVVDTSNQYQTLNRVVNVITDETTPFKAIKQVGDYYYILNSVGTPVVVKYVGNGGTITLPTSIESKAYYVGNLGLANLNIRDSKGNSSSNYKNPLTSVTFSKNVIDIGEYVLAGHYFVHTLKTHKIYSRFDKTMGNDGRNEGVRTIELLDGVTSLEENSLAHFCDLRTIMIPSSVTTYSDFFTYYSVKIVDIVNESNCVINRPCVNYYDSKVGYVTPMEKDGMFEYAYSYKDDKYYLIDVNCASSYVDIIVPSKYKNKEVVIYSGAFNGIYCNSLTLSEGITTLKTEALSGIRANKFIRLPQSAIYVGEMALDNIVTPTLYLPNITDVTMYTFSYGGSQGESIIHYAGSIDDFIEFSVNNIGSSYSSAIRNLTTLYCLDGNNVEYSVTTLDLSSYNWTEVPSYLFREHDYIERVILPSTIKTIKEYAFANCNSLESINLVEGLEVIEDYAFGDTTSLKQVNLPSTITDINKGFIDGGLTEIDIKGQITVLDQSAFYSCNDLTTVRFTAPIEVISQGAFMYCSSLQTVIFNDSLRIIGENAFYDCAISQANIPSVTRIESGAFYSNTELSNVTISSSCEYIGSRAFQDANTLLVINFQGTQDEWDTMSRNTNWNTTSQGKEIRVDILNN